jgi:SAM-dependent methyltransferase
MLREKAGPGRAEGLYPRPDPASGPSRLRVPTGESLAMPLFIGVYAVLPPRLPRLPRLRGEVGLLHSANPVSNTRRRYLWRCCTMAVMATEIDPAGLMPRVILESADFRDTRILEVGAGDGRLTFQYAADARSVVGVDTKEPDVRTAARYAGLNCYGHVQFVCASATALPFSAEQFGIVLLASSL